MNSKIEILKEEINKIDWLKYETAYSHTGEKIAIYLMDLFCDEKSTILKSTHMLWCSLCHQHAFVSSAALPAYDFLLYGLTNLDDYIKIEILDIFTGFAACTRDININESINVSWVYQLKEKLTNNLEIFRSFISHPNEDISNFSKMLCIYLENPKLIHEYLEE